jgi:hypothetical protein
VEVVAGAFVVEVVVPISAVVSSCGPVVVVGVGFVVGVFAEEVVLTFFIPQIGATY